MENKKVGILGYGEIGKAIAAFYEDPFIHDPYIPNMETKKMYEISDGVKLDYLHVCIPYIDEMTFCDAVKNAIARWGEGAIVFIHSTVPVGTTEIIGEYHKFVVHTPVRGVHPNLVEGIKTFTKYIGADFSGSGRVAGEHFAELGIPFTIVYKSRTTELLKLLDTTYYGLAIAYHAYAEKLCRRENVPFDVVMTDANNTYNQGYVKLDMSNVVRPVLYAPEDGKIGGHCVIQNADKLLEQYGDDPILQAILRHK